MIPQRLNLGQRWLQYLTVIASVAAIIGHIGGDGCSVGLLAVPLAASVLTIFMDRMK